ncbi:hypothetical protein [Pseudoroseomonas cervicalis]|uniref:hypothetical protein n=1 Tax=Teichococcus cervicalis TaxID=204525 RepID=UPI0022F19230|nr:hypothetical protein [Pseudoroseomonas cervicalis]WBV41781.1 hypothetical protein PFY06_11090 [Pseudoroseomonas cervicalis]
MAEWDVRPGQGIGPLRFGMDRAAVAALEAALGPVTDERQLGEDPGDVEAMLQPFGQWVTAEDISQLKAAMADMAAQQQGLVQQNRGNGLLLTFQDGALAEIIAPCHGPDITIGGLRVFAADRLSVVAALSRAAGDAPLTDGETIAYRQVPLWLHRFALGVPGFAPHPDAQSAREVSLQLRAGTLRGEAEIDWNRFRPLPLPEAP